MDNKVNNDVQKEEERHQQLRLALARKKALILLAPSIINEPTTTGAKN